MEPKPDIDRNSFISEHIQRLSHQIDIGEIPDQKAIDELRQFSPEEVTAAIFAKPPVIRGFETEFEFINQVPPAEADLKVAIPEGSESEIFADAVEGIRNYFQAPAIRDDFVKRHLDRREYEDGLYQVLLSVNYSQASVETEEITKISYSQHFQKVWNANKYSRNFMGSVETSLQTFLYFPIGSSVQNQLKQLFHEYRSLGIFPYEETIIEESEDPKSPPKKRIVDPMDKMSYEELDEKVRQVDDIAKRAMRVLSQSSEAS